MNDEVVAGIFTQIAFHAMDTGKGLKLEKGKNTSTSTLFGGAFSNSDTNYDSLILEVFQPEKRTVVIEEDEEE